MSTTPVSLLLLQKPSRYLILWKCHGRDDTATASGQGAVVEGRVEPGAGAGVSYTASSDSLSDKTKYDYFSRVVPPDKYQTEAMIELVDFYGWSYISTLHTAGNYGATAIRNVKKNAKLRGICIAYAKEVTRDSTDDDFDEIVRALRIFGKARVVVLFLGSFHVTSLLAAITRNNAIGQFIWIGSESFTREAFQGFEQAAHGAFSMEIPFGRVPGFETFYAQQRPWNGYSGSPWFGEFYREDFACSNTSSCDSLYPSITDIPTFHWSHWPSKVMDSVKAIALGLHALITDHCPHHNGNRTMLKHCANGPRLLRYIRNVSFEGYSAKTVSFDDNGDLIGGYLIKQVRLTANGEYTHDVIGRWNRNSAGVELNVSQIQWNAKTTSDNSSVIPESVCAKPCAVGEYYIQRELKCCWDCRRCRSNERLNAAITGCVTCDMLTWPDDVNHTSCVHIAPTYMRWDDPIGIGLAVLSCAGVVSMLLVTSLFVKHRNRKVIKGSSRELSGVIIVGLFVAYLTVMAFIYEPNMWSCYVNFFGFNISIAAIFAPLFIKTNRVYRIFSAAERCQVRVKLIGTGYQMVFASTAVLLQVGLSVGTAVFFPPTARLNMPVVTEKYVELQCDLQLEALLIPLSFNILLLLLCAVFGFLTRQLPDNFNESWYIFISVVTTIFIWIAFLPTYLVAFYAYHKAALLSLALVLNGSVTLLCLFAPKLYAVYWIDEKKIKVSNFGDNIEQEMSKSSSVTATNISTISG
ncbi:Metabotropic glutamate receptor 5 [Lamellibrachia satsuma]|nr:Metabotropic glutamate receptor 5 [Lamellibrachia satsuma]